jgi:hypothetical protein
VKGKPKQIFCHPEVLLSLLVSYHVSNRKSQMHVLAFIQILTEYGEAPFIVPASILILR